MDRRMDMALSNVQVVEYLQNVEFKDFRIISSR